VFVCPPATLTGRGRAGQLYASASARRFGEAHRNPGAICCFRLINRCLIEKGQRTFSFADSFENTRLMMPGANSPTG
jgi:hypothetical protein